MKVSIIIPVYGVSAYIERCLRSVMEQSFRDIECIIVDDASPDNSIDICNRMLSTYSGDIRFTVLHHEENRGQSAARNTGTDAATGEYLFYLDSDDEITVDCIEKLVYVATTNPDVEMIIGNIQIYSNNQKGAVMLSPKLPATTRSRDLIMKLNLKHLIPISPCNRLIKRSFIDNHHLYFKEGVIYEDALWIFYTVKYLSNVSFIQDITYHYCRRPGSTTKGSNRDKVGTSFIIIYDDILNHLTAGYEKTELKRYVDGFVLRYLEFRKTMPVYKDLLRLFRSRSRQFRCQYASLVLNIAKIVGFFGNPITLLTAINDSRWRIKKKTGEHPSVDK